MGNICGQYGIYLVKRHPIDFARYWIWPNAFRYFEPPAEIFRMNSPYFFLFRNDEYSKIALQYFALKTLMTPWSRISFRTSLLSWYPIFFCVLNVFFCIGFFGFFAMGGPKLTTRDKLRALLTVALLWLTNAAFSIIASGNVLRYQIFSMILQTVFGLVVVDMILRGSPISTSEKDRRIS